MGVDGESMQSAADQRREAIDFGSIPEALKALPNWVLWRFELDARDHPTKVPYQISGRKASSTRPRTWADYGSAEQMLLAHWNDSARPTPPGYYAGLGVMLGSDIYGIDVDHAVADDGELTREAQNIVHTVGSYTERSPSGQGVHVLLWADRLPEGRRRRGNVEIYGPGSPRFFTVTGQHVDGTPEVLQYRQEELEAVHADYVAQTSRTSPPSPGATYPDAPADQELVARITASRQGAKFARLWGGDWSAYSSQSEGDAALCAVLAYWCDGDAERVDDLFRRGGLMRAKWDERRGSTTYGAATVASACALVSRSARSYGASPSAAPARARRQRIPTDVSVCGDGEAGAGGAGEAKGDSQAAALLRIVGGAGVELFCDEEGEPWAMVPEQGHREVLPIAERGAGVRRWLVRVYADAHGRPPQGAAVAGVIEVLAARAEHEPRRPVFVRVAAHEGDVWLDLGRRDWGCVRVTRDGWRMGEGPAVAFRRSRDMQELAVPAGGGSLWPLWDVLRGVMDEGGFVLTVAWLIAALNPGRPYPILNIVGEQGTAKSTTARTIRSLIDPAGEGGRGLIQLPRDVLDLAAQASARHVLAFDNLSGLPPWMSDALSALATGVGVGRRALYSDFAPATTYARKPIILNGIAEVATRGDLLDRCVNVRLVAPARRLTEAAYWGSVESVRASVLGGLLSCAATALRNSPGVPPPQTRMADFAAWVIAAEEELGRQIAWWRPGLFMRVYGDDRADAVGTALEASSLYAALRRVFAAGSTATDCVAWRGTASELLQVLRKHRESDSDRKPDPWALGPPQLGDELRRIAPALKALGWTAEFVRIHGSRVVRLAPPPRVSGDSSGDGAS